MPMTRIMTKWGDLIPPYRWRIRQLVNAGLMEVDDDHNLWVDDRFLEMMNELFSRAIVPPTNEKVEKEREFKKLSKEQQEKQRFPLPSDFERWWKHYPRKIGKGAARKKWDSKLGLMPPWQVMLEHLAKLKRYWHDRPTRFIPHPTTWLNQERWNDEIPDVILKSDLDPTGLAMYNVLYECLDTLSRTTTGEDESVLVNVVNRMRVAYSVVPHDDRHLNYHLGGEVKLARKYVEYIHLRYATFYTINAHTIMPGKKIWKRFIREFQQSIQIDLTSGGVIKCAGKRWTILLNGES